MRNNGNNNCDYNCNCNCNSNCNSNGNSDSDAECCEVLKQLAANQGCNPNSSLNTFRVLTFILLLCIYQYVQGQICFYQNIVCHFVNYFTCTNQQMMCRNASMSESLMDCCINGCRK